MDKKRAIEIYNKEIKPIDPAKAIDFVVKYWWLISWIGEKIYTWIINKIKQKKNG